eukprot:2056421-Pleurochrysis_carterae.AAC.3
MPTMCLRSPALHASSATAVSCAGWLSLSASTLASRAGTATASHCDVRLRTPENSTRICAAPLVAALTDAAEG